MKDAYYYLYFLIVFFLKKTHKRLEPERWYVGGCMCVTLLTGCNGLSVFFLTVSKVHPHSGYYVGIPAGILNYYLLARADQGKEIFEEYDEKFASSPNKRFIKTLVILYIVVTFALITFLIVKYRQSHGIKG
jgi:hypothetical protein